MTHWVILGVLFSVVLVPGIIGMVLLARADLRRAKREGRPWYTAGGGNPSSGPTGDTSSGTWGL